MKSKYYLIIYASTGIILFFWLQSKNQKPKEDDKIYTWRHKKFSMEIGRDEWNGKLEQGEYTKSGILKIKQK